MEYQNLEQSKSADRVAWSPEGDDNPSRAPIS